MNNTASFFERHPKKTLLGVVFLLGVLCLFLLNMLAGKFGLGKTILYGPHPVYGYRPLPSQEVMRTHHHVKMNNLGLRANEDWDNFPDNKVLFLGDSVTYGGSYIDNAELFSTLAVKPFPGIQAGNAGVNGWGVLNVAAMVKDMAFLPAKVVVSIFPEGDFYRGLNRLGGQPLWTRQPHFALEELFQYFIYQINLKRMPEVRPFSLAEKEQIAELAVRQLKEMDNYLKAHHRTHLIYISPSRSQVLRQSPEDLLIKKLLVKYELNAIYLQSKLPSMPAHEAAACFHDEIHLSVQGHAVWAAILQKDLQAVAFKER